MTAIDDFAPPRPSPLRRILGIILAALAAIMLVGTIAGLWNPWHYVRLEQFFGNPLFGLVVVHVSAVTAFWLLAPVRSEAAQGRRHTWRWIVLVPLVPTLMCYGVFHRFFGITSQEVARSASGERRAALCAHADVLEAACPAGGARAHPGPW